MEEQEGSDSGCGARPVVRLCVFLFSSSDQLDKVITADCILKSENVQGFVVVVVVVDLVLI